MYVNVHHHCGPIFPSGGSAKHRACFGRGCRTAQPAATAARVDVPSPMTGGSRRLRGRPRRAQGDDAALLNSELLDGRPEEHGIADALLARSS